ncbi:MAG: HAD domain-containing protein [Verrucomicrobiales bacterium]|nr:HAD domain-containing protein [Verrucomicrobiales bacterium]MDF1826647.1 HAD domain-containing protein [Verrucomicrobiales bacterium]
MEESEKSRSRKSTSKRFVGDVLFLDVDGVLSCFAMSSEDLEPDKVRRLKRIVDACDPVIVVSSSWQFDPKQLKGLVDMIDRIGGQFGGTTCGDVDIEASDADSLEIRCLEIQGWLDRNGVPKRFVILDDDGDMGPLQPHLVQTDSFKGLTDELSDRVITQFSFSRDGSSLKSEAQE